MLNHLCGFFPKRKRNSPRPSPDCPNFKELSFRLPRSFLLRNIPGNLLVHLLFNLNWTSSSIGTAWQKRAPKYNHVIQLKISYFTSQLSNVRFYTIHRCGEFAHSSLTQPPFYSSHSVISVTLHTASWLVTRKMPPWLVSKSLFKRSPIRSKPAMNHWNCRTSSSYPREFPIALVSEVNRQNWTINNFAEEIRRF